VDLLRALLIPFALLLLALALAAGWYGRSLGAEVRLLQSEGVQVEAEIVGKWQHVPTRSDSDGTERAGIPTHYVQFSFVDPLMGVRHEDRSVVSPETWESLAVGERRVALVVPGRPEVNSLFGITGLGRAALQLGGLATWLGIAALACVALEAGLRWHARRQS
jgi:hypothetical protein